ncbi:MAG: tetratricopeptide repeat protein, partial [Pseudomonadota bacterium]
VTFFQAQQLATKNQRLSAMLDLTAGILKPADPYNALESPGTDEEGGGAAAFEAILDRAADQLQSASDQYSALEFTTLQHIVGMINYHMSRTDEARNLFQRALAVRADELGDDSPELIELLVQLTHVNWVARDFDAVCQQSNRAYDIARRNFDPPHALLAVTQGNLANYSRMMADFGYRDCAITAGQSIETLFTQALENYAAAEPSEEMAETWRAYSNMLNSLKRAEESYAAADEALRIDLKVHGPQHVKVAIDYSSKAVALMHQRQYQGATDLMDAAIKIHEEAVRARPRLQKGHLVRAYWIRGQLHEKLSNYERAFLDYRRSYEGARQLTNGEQEVGKALHGMAQSLASLGRPQEAEPVFQQAIAVFREVGGLSPAFEATLRGDYGALLFELRRLDDARAIYLEALALLEVDEPASFGPFPENFVIGVLMSGLGEVEAMACNVEQATALQNNAVKLLESVIPGFPQTLEAQRRLRALPPDFCRNAAQL